jgi:RNA polymerase sigma-70 factor (ECF subfamily)
MTAGHHRIEPTNRGPWSAEEFGGLLEAAKSGADWAWRRLVEAYSPPLLGYVRLRGAVEPEDVLSEVWMAAATGIRRFDGDEPAFRSWLFVIAHRRAIDAGRQAGRRPQPSASTGFDGFASRLAASAESTALEVISSEQLADLLSHLTGDQRTVVALRIIADLSLEETARIVGKRIGAVKALQRRALDALRQRLEHASVSS